VNEQRRLVRDLVATRPKETYRRCAYCDKPCYGLVCPEHRDLLTLDPNYSEARALR